MPTPFIGTVVICAGGGGIPTVYDEKRQLKGIEAVRERAEWQDVPIIVVTGSSGAGTSTVKSTFDAIFRREGVTAAVIEAIAGDNR